MRHLFAFVVVLAMLMAACSSSSDTTTTTTPDETTTTTAPDETTTTAAPEAPEAPAISLGYILPESGQLAFLGPPMIETTKLAVDLANEAGANVTLTGGDEAGDAAVAQASAQRLIGEGVNAIIGAAASGMSLAIIDSVTGAGVVQCSASNTAPTFTNYNDNGLYFRTAPSDALQGPVLAKVIETAGAATVAIIGRADDYGQGLAAALEGAFSSAEVLYNETYDPAATNYDAEVNAMLATNADAYAVVSFEEGAQIIKGLLEGGVAPSAIYGTDGTASGDLWESVDPGNPAVLEGMQGTRPGGTASEDFLSMYKEQTGLEDTTFAAQTYDCVNLILLAALASNSSNGADIAAKMIEVSSGGTACSGYAECAALLAAGEDIDYVGASGSADLDEHGEPASAEYEVWMIGADGSLSVVDTMMSGA